MGDLFQQEQFSNLLKMSGSFFLFHMYHFLVNMIIYTLKKIFSILSINTVKMMKGIFHF